MGTKLVGVNVPDDQHKKLMKAASKHNTTVTTIVLAGIDKELLFRELEDKYSDDYVLTDDNAYDTKAMIEQMVERKAKIGKEFMRRILS